MNPSKDAEMKDKGLYLRGTTYWARVVVPKDLRKELGNGPLRKSLGTSDRSTALLRLAEFRTEVLTAFAQARRRLSPTPAEPSPELVAMVAHEVRRAVLQADENARAFPEFPRALIAVKRRQEAKERRRSELRTWMAKSLGQLLTGQQPAPAPTGLRITPLDAATVRAQQAKEADPLAGRSEAEASALSEWNALGEHEARNAQRLSALRLALPWAEGVCREMGIEVDWTTPAGREGLQAILQTYSSTMREVTRRDEGEVIPTPPRPSAAQKAPNATTLDDMRDVWERSEPNRPADTLRKMLRSCDLLSEFLGRERVVMGKVTHAQADDFRSWLLNRGTAPKTAKDSLDCIKRLYALARKRRAIDDDPFAEVTIKAPKSTARQSWGMEDLKRLFSAPLFTDYAVPRPGESEAAAKAGLDAAYWVPLLCLHTGARVSEVCQLRTVDVRAVEGEEDPSQTVTVIDITEGAADESAGTKARRTKTASSIRRVPVHSTLRRLGFLDYVKAIHEAGQSQLFPAVSSREGAPAGEYFSTWFGTFKKSMGFGRWDDLHNMRHTMRTRLAVAGLPESAINVLAGHATGSRGSVGQQTYTHWRAHPQALARELEKLSYPGLILQRVYKAPVWTPT